MPNFIFVVSELSADGQLLLDDVEISSGDLNYVPAENIESFSILKDASATAIYGSRGANGVMIVTTKGGEYNSKTSINVTAENSFNYLDKFPEFVDGATYMDMYNKAALARNPSASPKYSATDMERTASGVNRYLYPDVNWQDVLFKNMSMRQRANVNISGGGSKVKYYMSLDVSHDSGLLNTEKAYSWNNNINIMNYTFQNNIAYKLTPTTTIKMNMNAQIRQKKSPNVSSEDLFKQILTTTPIEFPVTYPSQDDRIMYGNNIISGNTLYTNPYAKMMTTFAETNENTLNTVIKIDQDLDFITKGLSFKLKGSYNSSFTINKNLSGGTEMTYTPVLQSDGSVGLRPIDGSKYTNVSYGITRGKSRNWYMEAALNYNHSFGDHNIGALVLYNQSKEYYPKEYSDVPRGYVGLVGRVTYDWKNRYMVEANMGYNGSENFAADNRFALFPAASVGWVASEEKFWEPVKPVISFLKLRASFGLVGNDKIGGSRFMYTANPYHVNLNGYVSNSGYGTGNLAQLQAAYGYLFGQGGQTSTVSLGAHEWAINNANVTWEKAFKQNYGVDINFLNDRLSATIEYYKEHRWDILLQDGTAPSMLGFAQPFSNLGEVNNWGWELSLKWNDKIGKDFRYWAGINLSYNQNEIIERKEAPQEYDYLYQKGHRIGSRKQYAFWRYYDEQTPALYEQTFHRPFPTHSVVLQDGDAVYVDLNGDRKIDENDMGYDYGFTDDPEYMVGMNLGFSWKNLEVNTQWTGAWNVSRMISDVFRRPFLSSSGNVAGGLLAYHLTNTWTKENPSQDAKYPRATWENADNNYAESTLYEQDSKYLRLKTLTIAYNFQFPLMKKLGMSTCQLSFSGYNLWTLTPYLWGDPEARASNAPSYPLTKTYTLGLKLGF